MMKIEWASSPNTCHRAQFARTLFGIRAQIETWTGLESESGSEAESPTTPSEAFPDPEATLTPSRVEWATLARLMPVLTHKQGKYRLDRAALTRSRPACIENAPPSDEMDLYIEVRREFNRCCPPPHLSTV